MSARRFLHFDPRNPNPITIFNLNGGPPPRFAPVRVDADGFLIDDEEESSSLGSNPALPPSDRAKGCGTAPKLLAGLLENLEMIIADDRPAQYQPAAEAIRKNVPKLRAAMKAIDELQEAFDRLADPEQDHAA